MAKALEQYFKYSQCQDETILEVHLDRNGLKDAGLAAVLRGLAIGNG